MDTQSITPQAPKSLKWIAILIGITTMRAMAISTFSTLEMFGGHNPDAWFAPWVADTILGVLAPFMIYSTLKKRGLYVWAGLLIYNAIGAFDYVHGLATEYFHPLVPDGIFGTPELTFGAVGFSLAVQLTALFLLLRNDIALHYTRIEE